jgi:hypothetical protein
VTDFRLYLFDMGRAGHGSVARGVDFSCKDQLDAIREAERRREGAYAELWRRERLVKIFEGD